MCNTYKKKLITKVIVSVLAVGSLYNYNICDTNNCFAEDLDGTNSEGHVVEVNDGDTYSSVYGIKSDKGEASNGKVNIKGGMVTGIVLGGYAELSENDYDADDNNVGNNEINISGGTVSSDTGSIIAGEAKNGNVINNRVNITGGNIDVSGIYGGAVFSKGKSNENKLNIKGISNKGLDIKLDSLYGGFGVDEANNNKLCIENSIIEKHKNKLSFKSSIYGGWSFGNTNNNSVHIKGSTVYSADIIGGYSSKGNVIGNRLILDSVTTVNNEASSLIVGGYIMNGNTNSANTGNNIIVKGDSHINSQIVGGFSENSSAEGNVVTVERGTITGYIAGGYSNVQGFANSNTVDIQGGTIEGTVVGGYSDEEAIGNTIKLKAGADVAKADLYGARGEAVQNGTVSNNSLDVYGFSGMVNSLNNFDNINIGEVGFEDGAVKITATEASNLKNASLNATFIGTNNTIYDKGENKDVIVLNNISIGNSNITNKSDGDIIASTADNNGVEVNRLNLTTKQEQENGQTNTIVNAEVTERILAGKYTNNMGTYGDEEGKLTISDGFTTTASTIAGSYSSTADKEATGGTVVVNGKYTAGKTSEIYAGYSENGDGKVSGNTIELQSGADVSKADLYGVNDEAVANASSNNLNINGFSGTVNSLNNFDNINIDEVGFEDGAVNITSRKPSNLENASLNATFTGTNNTIYDKGENKDVIVLNNISIGNSNITNKSDRDIIASTADNNGVEVNRLNLTTKQEQENGQTNTIVNAEVTERILAGKYTNSMGTYGNEEGKLTISDGFTTTASTISGSYSSAADKEAIGGTVVINGAYTARNNENKIYAGYSENGDGKVNGNTIKLQSGADVSKADLYGANDEAVQNNNASNNSLNIDGFNGAVNSLKNFDNLNFGDVSFNSNIQLTANTFSDLSKATINVSSYNKNTEIYDEGTTGKIITLNNIKVEKDATGLDNAYGDIVKETGNGVQVNRLNVDTDYSDEEKKTTVTATVDKYILAGSYTNKDKTYGTTDGVLTLGDDFNSNVSTIAGSYSSAADKEAMGGTVVVNGKYTAGKTSEIYAGYSENGDGRVSGNTIKLQSGADVSKADLYGANDEAVKNNNASNNSLNVDGFSGKVNSINNFNQIDLGTVKATNETFDKNLDNAVLNVQSKGDLSDTDIKIDDITVDENLDLATGTQKTLIGGNNVTTDETTSVSASDEATANKYVQTANGVRIHAFAYGANDGEVTATVKRSVLTSKYIDENNNAHGENIVHIDDDFQTNAETITGSYAAESNKATGGEVIIDGNYDGKIYAGYSENGDGEVSGNTVTVNSNVNAKDTDLWGRNTDTGKDNNLNVNGKEVVIGSVKYFDNINMNNIEWENNKTVLTIDNGKDSDLSDTNINVNNLNVQGGATINVNDSMNLISGEDLNINGDKINIGEDFTAGVTAVGKGEIVADNNGLSYKIDEVAVNPQTSLIAENRAVATAFINQGSDLIASGLDSLHDQYGYGFKTFAAVYGNRSTYDAGSDLKINGWSEIIGLGSTKRINDGDLDWGLFYENGSGNYRTYNQFNDEFFRGDGSMVYNGGGVAARFTKDNGWYYEGSLRAGTLKSEIDHALKDGMGNTYGYKSDTTYYGAHLGLGKILSLSDSQDLNVYGKYFHTYNDGDDFTIAGDRFSFDSVTSDRIMLGAKLTTNKNNIWQTHYGLAWEYEFNGDSDMTAGQFNLPTQSLKGSTFIGEIGFSYRDDKFSPWSFDLDFKGYQGQRDGFSGHAQVTYNF